MQNQPGINDRLSAAGADATVAPNELEYAAPKLIELGDAARLTKYYSSGTNNDGSSDHPRVWWN